MFPDRTQDNHAHAVIFIECLEHHPQLIALRHFDDVERRAVENDVGAFLLGIHFHAETVELRQARVGKCERGHVAVPSLSDLTPAFSGPYSPATGLRRNGSPTGDLAMSAPKT